VQKLTQADKDSVSYTDFSRGLIEGSVNLVNELNAEQVTETLVSKLGNIDTTKLNETADKAQTAVSNVSSAANAVNPGRKAAISMEQKSFPVIIFTPYLLKFYQNVLLRMFAA
jgi:hypothetical protein